MTRFKDLGDPALAAELRRRAEAAAAEAAAAAKTAADLQSVAEAAAAAEVAAAAPALRDAGPASASAGDDTAGFATLFGNVEPLAVARRHWVRSRPPLPHPHQRAADEARALQASRAATSPGPMAWDVGLDIESAQSFVRTGLNPDLLRKLRRGHWVVQGALDLHRHTQEQARIALADFLASARRHGWRCVRIVHGKGLSSPNREPVLKGKVRKWLQQRDDVLAYCEPRPHAGGGGAVVVLLAGPGRM
jgi:DNA-nicking Smr family endonuclease